MKLSVIVPAYNEAKRIEACLQHLSEGLRSNCRPAFEHELIVVDNNSTDPTAELARPFAAVIFEPVNQIARARNAGARAATGDWLLFVDADTLVSAGTIQEMLAFIDSDKFIGGGTILRYDRTPILWKSFLFLSNRIVIPLLRWTPGCFIFCRADVFREFGGFNEKLFAGEDVEFGKAMVRCGKRRGRGVALLRWHPPITSIRKIDLYGSKDVFCLILRWLLIRDRTTKDKRYLNVFYDGRR